MSKKSTKPKGDRVGNAFSRFPMLMIKIINSLEKNNSDTTLEKFLSTLGASETWFNETCIRSKIFNTFPLDQIGVFELYTQVNSNHVVNYIKLTERTKWEHHYKEALDKVLKV